MATIPLGGMERFTRWSAFTARALLVIALSTAGGAGLAAIGSRFGSLAPALIIGIPLLLVMIVAVLADPRIGIIAVFATFPLGAVAIPAGFASLQITEAVVLAVGALIILRRLGERRTPLPWEPALWWALALLGWSLVSLPGALDQELAIKQVLQLVGGLVFVCVVIAACRDFDDVRMILGGLTVISVVVAILALASGEEMRAALGGSVVGGRATGPFDQPNQLGAFCAVTAVIAAGLMFGARTRRNQLLCAFALALLTGGLLLSLSRGAWVGTTLAIIFLLASLKQARRGILAFSVPLLVVAFLLGSFEAESPQLEVVGQRVRAFTVLSPYDGRDQIWAEARREIIERPVTGFGPGNFPIASTRSGSESTTVRPHHAHNLLLTWAAETGLPGALAIIGLGVALFLVGRRAARAVAEKRGEDDRAVVVSLQAGLIAVAGQGIVDYTLRNSVLFLVFWAIIGALLAADRTTRSD